MIRALVSTSIIFILASDVVALFGLAYPYAMHVAIGIHVLGVLGLVTAGLLSLREKAME